MFDKEQYVQAIALMLQLDATGVNDLRKMRLTTLASIFENQQKNLEAYNVLNDKFAEAEAELSVAKAAVSARMEEKKTTKK